MGIEPTSQPWEGRILPMNYTRIWQYYSKGDCKFQPLFVPIIRQTPAAQPQGFYLFHNGSVGVKQGQFFQINQILTGLCVTLSQNRHLAADNAASLFNQNL